MRIGIDFRPALFSGSGFGRYVLELVKALSALDSAPEIALFGDAWRSYEREPLLRAALQGVPATLHRTRLPGRVMNVLARFGFGVEHRLGGIDVFHHTDLIYPPVRRTPTVVTIHDVSFDVDESFHGRDFGERLRPRLRRALARAAAVIVPGEETKSQLAARYAVDPKLVRVIPYGAEHLRSVAPDADAVDRRLARLGIDGPIALCVGTIEPRKNHARLLRAFGRLIDRVPHHLVVVGKLGWLYDEAQAELARLSGSRRVHHFDDCEDGELRALHDRAEFAVYPSLYEGFGFPAVEALALGLPLITGAGGSLGDVVGDGALRVDPRDEGALGDAMLRVAESSALRDELTRRGLARAAQLTWARCAEKHLAVYREVQQRGQRRD